MSGSDRIIQDLSLSAHPEGGYFRAVYPDTRSPDELRTTVVDRGCASHIYYLLVKEQHSRLHQLDADEMFHYYCGWPLILVELQKDGPPAVTTLGCSMSQGQTPYHVIRAGTWFGAYLPPGADYSLVGCTVVPAFRWESFRLSDPKSLIHEYPHCYDVINMLS